MLGVFLVVTGAEALYADMGYFGANPIRQAWFLVVLPGLILNYLGQGALLLRQPEAADNPFFRLAPGWGVYPLVALSTMAGVIASQALISGTYSLAMQAVQMGYLPRLKITHTSHAQRGQIYMPQVNFTLMIACVGLVLSFASSTRLAAAYGVAVSLTLAITTALFVVAARRLWRWGVPQLVLFATVFLSGNPEGTPIALLHNLKHNKGLHEQVVLLNLRTLDRPIVALEDRLSVEPLKEGVWRIVGRYGFMESPHVPDLLRLAPMETTFFLSRETLIPTRGPGLAYWRKRLFAAMSGNAQSAAAYFNLPPNRVVELGMQVEV